MNRLMKGNADLEESSTWVPPAGPAERPMLPGHEHLVDQPFADYFITRNSDGHDSNSAGRRAELSIAERQP